MSVAADGSTEALLYFRQGRKCKRVRSLAQNAYSDLFPETIHTVNIGEKSSCRAHAPMPPYTRICGISKYEESLGLFTEGFFAFRRS